MHHVTGRGMPLSRTTCFGAIESLAVGEGHAEQWLDVLCDHFQLFHRRRRQGHSRRIHATPETSAGTIRPILPTMARYLGHNILYTQRLHPQSPAFPSRFPVVAASLRRDCVSTCKQTSENILLTDFTTQATQRRVPTFSRHDVLNATPSAKVKETRSVPTCTGCSAVTLVPSLVSRTPMPTRQRALNGRRTLWYVYSLNLQNSGGEILTRLVVRIP
jgi:hypothetical protein